MELAASQTAFVGSLPHRPYCTDDPLSGIYIRSQSTALRHRHIQHNPPPLVSSLVFDVDMPDGYHAWQDRGLPTPHWVSVNRTNGHAHLGYLLATPVARTSAAKAKPLRYLAAIEHVLAKRLGADMGYSGLITKNPVHLDWLTVWHNHEPYSLDYLAEFCPDDQLAAYSRRSRKELSGLGRNVALFDNVREWAYSAVREYWKPNGYDAWAEAVRGVCDSANAFGLEQGGPLPVSEIKATAKSIARWVWQRFTPSEFRAIQAARGAKGGRIGGAIGGRIGGKVSKGGGRPKGTTRTDWTLWEAIQRMKAQGYSHSAIAEDLKISASTVSKYAKISK